MYPVGAELRSADRENTGRARARVARGRSAVYNIDMFNDTAARDNGLVNNEMWKLRMLKSEMTVATSVESS